MGVYKEINRADGSGVTTFYRISDVLDTAETDDQEGQAVIIDYNSAQNKPSINGVALVGNKTSEDLGLQPAGDYITNDEADEKFIDEDELEAKNYVNQAELQDAIAHIEHFHREIVEALPVTGMDNVLYMVRKGGTGEDIYNEYIWVGLSNSENGYEFIGTTAADLTDYYTKTQVDTALAGKVDKDGNKGLSEQNYTLAEKTKLAGLENYDDSELQADVASLNTRVNSVSTSTTALNNRVTAIEPKVETNSAAVTTIYDLLDKKMTAIRLVEQGDGWVWMNLEGSRLTYAQASAALGHENCMLFIEQLENDGKVIPAEYKSEGDHINVIFKDLDSLVHIMTCGEDDAVVTQTISTTDGECNFTVEDEAVGYGAVLDAIYGDTYQQTYTGKNLLNVPQTYTWTGCVTLTNPIPAGTYAITCGKVTKGGADYPTITLGSTYKFLTDDTTEYVTISNDIIQIDFYASAHDWAASQGTTCIVEDLMISAVGGDYEPYTGGIPSPNPDQPQDIHVVKGNDSIKALGKNLLKFTPRTDGTSYSYVCDNKGQVTITGTVNTSTGLSYNLPSDYITLKTGTYKMKVIGDATGVTFTSNNAYATLGTLDSNQETTVTVTQDVSNFRIWQYLNTGITYNCNYYITLTRDNTATTERYQEQVLPLNLLNIELCKLGNYQDKIYKQNDIWYLHKEIGKVVLDGSETWINDNKTLDNTMAFYSLVDYINSSTSLKTTLEDKFTTEIHDTYVGTDKEMFEAYGSGATKAFNIRINKNRLSSLDAMGLKAWLSNNNVTVYYIKAVPTDTEIEDPTLLAQLNALEQITQYKYTYITITGADLTPEADFTYISDIVINNSDHVLGKDTYWNDEVPTSIDLPVNAQEGEIRIVQDTEAVYIYDGTDWIPFDKGTEVDLSNYLAKDNTTAWIPTGAFNPATKKYVDDSVSGIHVPTKTSQLQNDSNFVNKNANDLTNYYPKSNTYTKAEVDALIHSGGSEVQIIVVGDTLVITTTSAGGE